MGAVAASTEERWTILTSCNASGSSPTRSSTCIGETTRNAASARRRWPASVGWRCYSTSVGTCFDSDVPGASTVAQYRLGLLGLTWLELPEAVEAATEA
jgi:hypothetical protein